MNRLLLEAARLLFAAIVSVVSSLFEPPESMVEIVTMLGDMGMISC